MFFQKPPFGTQLDWSNPLNKGCVLHLAMNEGNGDHLQDLSMYGNHGTMSGFAYPPTVDSGWNPGKAGIGLNFDGANDTINCGNKQSIDIIDAATAEGWIKTMQATTHAAILSKGGGATTNYVLEVCNTADGNNGIRFFGYSGGISKGIVTVGGVPVDDDKWHHIIGTFDGTNWKIYIDGILDRHIVDVANLTPTVQDVYVGSRATARLFDGSIDEVRILNRVYTAKEVLKRYINPYQVYLDEDD